MSLWPGDTVTGDDGGEFELGRMVTYQGKEGCDYGGCTRVGCGYREDGTWDMGKCRGWHCSRCDAPTSMLGHDCPLPFPRKQDD